MENSKHQKRQFNELMSVKLCSYVVTLTDGMDLEPI